MHQCMLHYAIYFITVKLQIIRISLYNGTEMPILLSREVEYRNFYAATIETDDSCNIINTFITRGTISWSLVPSLCAIPVHC